MCAYAQLLSCVQLFVTPMDYSLPISSVHGIFQARILEWVGNKKYWISYSRESSYPVFEPTSPALQADSLPLSHWGSPR